MKSYKRVIESALLNRMAHMDVFEVGAAPDFLFVLFGGSGVDQEEYELRSRSVIPLFGRLLGWLETRSLNFVLGYVSAPFDLPFNRFDWEPAAAATWNTHVAAELLTPWLGAPYFVCGFSGGAALALNGIQADSRCFGAGALGADALPPDFVCPEHWVEPLRLYSAPQDRVCNHPDTVRAVEALVRREQAELVRLPSGMHSLADYSTRDGLGELICWADRLAPRPSC